MPGQGKPFVFPVLGHPRQLVALVHRSLCHDPELLNSRKLRSSRTQTTTGRGLKSRDEQRENGEDHLLHISQLRHCVGQRAGWTGSTGVAACPTPAAQGAGGGMGLGAARLSNPGQPPNISPAWDPGASPPVRHRGPGRTEVEPENPESSALQVHLSYQGQALRASSPPPPPPRRELRLRWGQADRAPPAVMLRTDPPLRQA